MALPRGMKRCNKSRRCPVCTDNRRAGDSHCLYIVHVEATGTDGYLCMKSGGGQDGASMWKPLTVTDENTGNESLKPTAAGGHIYVPSDAKKVGRDFSPAPPSPERQAEIEKQRLADEAYAVKARAFQVKLAKKAWAAAGTKEIEGTGPAHLDGKGPHHRRVAEYIEARGIKLADLPGGVVPRALRYDGACVFMPKNGAGKMVEVHAPALVASCVDADGNVSAVQRTILDPSGIPAKAKELEAWPVDCEDAFAAKMTLGSKSVGVATRLMRDLGDDGTLILAEGLETALACLAATSVCTWSIVDTSGLKNLNLPAAWVDRETGTLKTVIIAADCDRGTEKRGQAGQKAAKLCADKLVAMYPHLVVKIATPSAEVSPSCFDADGQPNGKGVDWLDVYLVVGKDVVRRCLLEDAEVVAEGDGGNAANAIAGDGEDVPGFGGDEGRGFRMLGGVGPVMPAGELSMARQLLVDWPDFAPPKEARADQRWLLCRFRGKWYRYVRDDRPRWVLTDDELLAGHVHTRMQFYTKDKKGVLLPLAPPLKTAKAVLQSMVSDCGAAIDSEPAWLPATFDDKGTAKWSEGIVEVPRGAADTLIPCTNGILDISELVKGRARMRRHSPRHFSLSCRPFTVDIKLLERMLVADEAERTRLGERHFPVTMGFLKSASRGCPMWVERFWRWCGLNLTSDVSFQKMAVFIGGPGRGKSLGAWILTQLVGEGGWASTTLGRMVSQFGPAQLLGKTCAIIGDMSTGKFVDVGQAKEVILNATGDDAFSIEFKGKDAYTAMLVIKITAAMNQFVKMADESGALHRRILPFQFGPVLGKADPMMKQKIGAELAAVFCAALAGLARLYKDRDAGMECWPLTRSESSLLDAIREENEPLFKFKEDRLEEGPGLSVARADVYADYLAWFKEEHPEGHQQPLSAAWLGRKLRGMCAIDEDDDGQQGSGNRSERRYVGIRLKPLGEAEATRSNGAAVAEDREHSVVMWAAGGPAASYARDARPSHPTQDNEPSI